MLHLLIEAENGPAYQAQARLEDGSGSVLATGMAVLAARDGYKPVPAGQYLLADVKTLPPSPATLREWGNVALMFMANNHRYMEPVMLHGGEMIYQGRSRAVYGSIRVDDPMLRALLQQVQRPDRPQLLLTLRVGEKPSAWRFWDQPSRDTLVERDDDGADMFEEFWPELVPYANPNAGRAWTSYFDERGESPPPESPRSSSSESSQSPSSSQSESRSPHRDDQSVSAQAFVPLFGVSSSSGVDSVGRVIHADPDSAPPATECLAPSALDAGSPVEPSAAGADQSSCMDISTESTTSY